MLELEGRGPITLKEALDDDENVIKLASYVAATKRFYQELWDQRESVMALVKHHIGLGIDDTCVVPPPREWIRGSFNVCIMVEVNPDSLARRKVVFRCPLPHKLAETTYSGSIDEKLSCEVGAHAWIEEHCPEIRTPHLFGFGFSDKRHFTHAKHLSFLRHSGQRMWRLIYSFIGHPLLSQYVTNSTSHSLDSAYMLLEYLGPETGQMLSDTFAMHREDEARRQKLFKGISRILLSLARIPQQRIGSFRFHDDGTVTLTNRPLSCSVMIFENDGAPRVMHPDETYGCTESYVSDLLTLHDRRFLHQPNAAYDDKDCRGQMAVKTLLRAISHLFITKNMRNGPFPLQLTDFHASNLLVDEDWNVTGLLDLEWVCSRPSEMFSVPYWLSGCDIDGIEGENLDRFDQTRLEFMRIFEREEKSINARSNGSINLSSIMVSMWRSKGVWFWYCLSSVNAMYFLLDTHLVPPKSFSAEAERVISRFWGRDPEDVVRRKLASKQAYDEELRKLFAE
ncbi:hypothetical protein CcaCcLH18_10948 [Colletotrichum camelliae]|nr:hypothetical protein CcaCcLH18_10948 [Colletotrichum camelliae]